MDHPSVLIGMSGGVDSSTAALLLLQAGYTCGGATMQLWEKTDCSDAARVCSQLGIPHRSLDCRERFCSQVVDYFSESYARGRTPNPCIVCNRTMKFGWMLDQALALGYDYVATGHYAKIRRDPESGMFQLLRAGDRAKDQTYFLYSLSQFQLAHTLFPLGDLSKPEIRALAESRGLATAHKHDSQDICFIPDGDYAAFLRSYTGREQIPGCYLDLQGNVIGTHRGAVCYTIGQRRGLGIALGAPAYVCAKDMDRNTVTLGPNEALMHRILTASDFHWIQPREDTDPIACTAKIRHTQFDQPATAWPQPDGGCRVEFQQPQRAITPGQAVVLYQGDLVLGGGTIEGCMDD